MKIPLSFGPLSLTQADVEHAPSVCYFKITCDNIDKQT